MKHNKILQLVALTACSLPMALSLGSCTEEDIIDNYGSVLVDSTYFTYDLSNLFEAMGGTDFLHIYTYETSGGKGTNLKHLKIQKQDGRIYVESPAGISASPNGERSTFGEEADNWVDYNLNGDKVTWTHSGTPYTASHFSFGAGVFRTVAVVQRTNPGDCVIDEAAVLKALKYPSYDNMKDAWFEYLTGTYSGELYGEQQTPWWGWTDKNVYQNVNGENAPYIRIANGLSTAGIAHDTLKIGTHKTIVMQPVQSLRNYTVSVEIQKAEELSDFVVTTGYACISGVPERLNFYYQIYDTENTCKLPFRLRLDAADNAANKTVKLSRTLGFMNVSYGPDTLLTTSTNGPGVIQLIIPCKWNGNDIVLQALCNISKSIKESGIIRKEKAGWKWGGKTELPIKISTKITAEMLQRAKKGETLIWKD